MYGLQYKQIVVATFYVFAVFEPSTLYVPKSAEILIIKPKTPLSGGLVPVSLRQEEKEIKLVEICETQIRCTHKT